MIKYKFRTQEPQHLPPHEIQSFYLSRARRDMDVFFFISARFHILSSPLHSRLRSLIADYNPSHTLLTQLRTLITFSRKL